jgi:hypothetical protein
MLARKIGPFAADNTRYTLVDATGRLYVHDDRGVSYVQLPHGELQDVIAFGGPRPKGWFIDAHGDHIVIESEKKMYVLDHTGSTRWGVSWVKGVLCSDDGLWLFDRDTLVCIDWLTGRELWRDKLKVPITDVSMHPDGNPVVYSGRVVYRVRGDALRRQNVKYALMAPPWPGCAPRPSAYSFKVQTDIRYAAFMKYVSTSITVTRSPRARAELMLRLQRRLPPDLQRMVVEYLT